MKKIITILCAVMMALTLTACGGGGSKEVSVDVEKLATELQGAVSSDTLTKTASEIALSTYFLESGDVAECSAYTSSGATACEVAVIKSNDKSKTGDVEKCLKARVESQSELYASYNEGEVAKLDKAIIKSAGAYTVLVVCDDVDAANKTLKSYGF